MQRKGSLRAQMVGMRIGAAPVESIWRFLKKVKIELSYDPEIPLLGVYPKEMKTLILKDMCTQCS